MSDMMGSFEFFTTLLGPVQSIGSSKDGRATSFNGEIASGIGMTIYHRDSNSCGIGIDASIDGRHISHIEGDPKF